MKRWTLWVALCLLLTCLLTGCGDDGTGKGFRFPVDREPTVLDPQMATDTSATTLLSVLFEGLTRLDPSGKPVPGAADWTLSEDGTVYTFTLRESYWSTLSIRGEETPWDEPQRVTAADFVYGVQRAVSPLAADATAQTLYAIAGARAVHEGKQPPETLGVQAVSDNQLTITLTAPDADFLAVLATTPCMPCNQAFFDYTSGRYGLEKAYLLTNGPFYLAAWNHNESLLLYKHETYHAVEQIAPEAVRFVIDAPQTAEALHNGTLDVVALPPKEITQASDAGATLVSLEDTVRSLWFNTAADPMTLLPIRQALRDSIEWDTVYAYLQQAGEAPAVGYVPPAATVSGSEPYRREDNRRPFTTRIQQAQQRLNEGLAILYPEKAAPRLPTITVVAAEDAVSADLARYIIQSWQKNLKITATLVTVPATELERRMQQGFYPGGDVAIWTHTPTGLTGSENLSRFATGAIDNTTGWSNAAVDAAIRAAKEGGRAELDALEGLLAQQCPCLPLSYPKRYYGIAAGCDGITLRPFNGGVYGSPLEFLQAKKWD